MVKQRAGNNLSRFFRFDDERDISRPTTTFRGFGHSFETKNDVRFYPTTSLHYYIFTQHTMPIF
jgi:hypothetical protein